jgi:hypothetical protein
MKVRFGFELFHEKFDKRFGIGSDSKFRTIRRGRRKTCWAKHRVEEERIVR